MIEQASENPKPVFSASVPDSVPFQCRICGECCSSFNIPIEADKARHLLSRDWARERLRQTRRELVKVTDALYRIPLSDENVCVFLGEDNRCMVETHEGRDAKPTECRNFPFAAVRMPDGQTAYDTSASCKSVAETLLLAFGPIVPADPPALESHPFPARVPVSGRQSWSVAEYQAYLARLHELFQSDIAPDQALFATDGLLTNRPADRPFHLSPRLERWLALFLLRKPYGAYSWFTLLGGLPYADPRVFGEPLSLAGQAAVEIPAETNRLVNAFLYNLLQRKVLLTRDYSLSDMLGLAGAALVLVRWYARTLAHMTGRTCATQTDISMAVRLCERYYTGHQPRFLAWFPRHRRGGLLARLLFSRHK